MQCCTANGTLGLYYAWEGALREDGDCATVNLLLNRGGKLVDVESHLPYEGRVVIRNRAASRVTVRIPAWVPRRDVRLRVAGVDRPLDWVGNYLVAGDLNPGDTVEVSFPVRETTARYTMNAHTEAEQVYTLTLRGSTVVDIAPRILHPTRLQLYQREALKKAGPAPVRKVQRFVAERVVRGW
jgi:hypothetical protein